jgi:outer membrane protein OmpA-like peptidoglycan-associated protein
MDLSIRRAEAVKAWFVTNAGFDSAMINTCGFGKTRLIVPPGTIQQEKPNRRVVIYIMPR